MVRDVDGGAANWTNGKKAAHYTAFLLRLIKLLFHSLLPAKLPSYSSSVIPTAGLEHLRHCGRMKGTWDLITTDSLLALLQLIIIQKGPFGQN